MFDIGLPEMLVLVVITLLVVGPKDLPRVIRGFARAIAKMRRMVDEFMGSVNDYVRESELAEFKEAMDKTRAAVDPKKMAGEYIDPTGVLKDIPGPNKPSADSSNSSSQSSSPTKPAPSAVSDDQTNTIHSAPDSSAPDSSKADTSKAASGTSDSGKQA